MYKDLGAIYMCPERSMRVSGAVICCMAQEV
jgi:hypothetical protein